MPIDIDGGAGEAIALEDLVDALEASDADLRDLDAFAAFGALLARLARNRTFLADLAIGELEQRFAGQALNAYGAQVLMLRPPNGRYMLRANFWPALGDAVVKASGTAPFFYDLPHDHNFSFLTVGYLGPGYWSDYYRFDGATGLPGEAAGLVFEERSRLAQGRVLLYRAHRDVHVQLPPDAFSVSLNILAYEPAQQWRTQYRFDTQANRIVEALTVTPAETLVALAVHFGGDSGCSLAREMAARHPVARMRATAIGALASAARCVDERVAVLSVAADDADALVAGRARAALAAIDRSASAGPGRG